MNEYTDINLKNCCSKTIEDCTDKSCIHIREVNIAHLHRNCAGCTSSNTDGNGGYSPYIGENGNWFEWSAEANDFVDTGIHAEGPQGEKGDIGPQGLQGEQGPKGDAGTSGKMILEYATIVPKTASEPSLSGSAMAGYSTDNFGASASGTYNYDLTFPTPYNQASDMLEIQHFNNDTWTVWTSAACFSLSDSATYGIGFIKGTGPDLVGLHFGRAGSSYKQAWSGRTIRVVKRTFPI